MGNSNLMWERVNQDGFWYFIYRLFCAIFNQKNEPIHW